ncbi:jg7088 [Pararge aegeria aegeria]|uniref:Jg7088 protein n=1 Tax=Pararge aegeria aegeria TaxID=348720 RepID=A0A8S4R1E4_9NEOP|nr:jg7088 [Pararge aegeria aegeria]
MSIGPPSYFKELNERSETCNGLENRIILCIKPQPLTQRPNNEGSGKSALNFAVSEFPRFVGSYKALIKIQPFFYRKPNKRMAGSRERLLYDRHLDFDYEYERRRRHEISRFEAQHLEPNRIRTERFEQIEKPKRKNGYVFEDIYSDFDEAQGRLSLFRPIRPEYLNLQTSYVNKYNSLPRNQYYNDDRRRYKKDYYDFRIEAEKRKPRESYEHIQKERIDIKRNEIRLTDRNEHRPNSINRTQPNQKPKNVAVCKPLRLSEKNVKYWTTDPPEKDQVKKPKKDEAKKIVKFSEVSGCRKMVIDDPICGRKVVAVRELEVSLDQMIQNGYFEKHNIPIRLPEKQEEIKGNVPNGKCLSGTGGEIPVQRKSRHLPQVRL